MACILLITTNEELMSVPRRNKCVSQIRDVFPSLFKNNLNLCDGIRKYVFVNVSLTASYAQCNENKI